MVTRKFTSNIFSTKHRQKAARKMHVLKSQQQLNNYSVLSC